MIYSLYKILVLVALVAISEIPLAAQAATVQYEEQQIESRTFNSTDWEDFSASLDYSAPSSKAEELPERSTERSPEPTAPPDRSNFDDFPDLSPLFKILLIILVTGTLGWIIYNIVRNSERSFATDTAAENEEELVSITRLEKELDRRSVGPYLLKAENNQNYHLAVRLHFLALLKQMNEQGLIRWKKNRTNRAYLNQVRGQRHYETFHQLTLTFEHIWYGNHPPSQEEYEKIKAQFSVYRDDLENAVAV